MTILQKEILEFLIEGGSISGNIKYGYRLRDKAGNPITRFSHRTFFSLKPNLRMEKGQFVLNRKFVRSLSKRFWIKKAYLNHLKKSK